MNSIAPAVIAHGDATEEWREVPNYSNYEVSNRGCIRRAVAKHNWPAGHELKPAVSRRSGHQYVMLVRDGNTKKQWVHRLVALAFIGPPPSPDAIVRHLDDVPSNNVVENLRWGTRLDNHNDRMRNKGWNRNTPKGSRVGGAKLTEADIPRVRSMRRTGASLATIAQKFGIHIVTVSDVIRGRSWGHVPDEQPSNSNTLIESHSIEMLLPRGPLMSGFTPSDAQTRAITAIKDWFINRTAKQQVFRVFGYAGSGKTTITRHAIEELGLEDGPNGVLYSAFTGKAALVMTRKGTPASTIHSLIYRVSEATPAEIERIKEEIADLKAKLPAMGAAERLFAESQLRSLELRLADSHKPRFVLNEQSALRDAKLLVLDEVSMVGDAMARDLLAFGKPILVLGDPGQLPPVKGEGAFTQAKPDVMLTEIHRQAGESAIIRLATLAREGKPIPYGEHDTFVWKMRRDEVTPAQMLCGGQVICGRNATRLQLNLAMKRAAGFDGVYPSGCGEKIICLKNRNDLGLINGMFLDLTEVKDEDDISCSAVITTEDGQKIGGANGARERFRIYKGYFADHVAPDPERQRRDHWKKKTIIEAVWGWAITCHKAQGSQWENVIVFDDGLGRTAEDRAHWLYTAITRAERGLVILD